MESFKSFLQKLETSFDLSYKPTKGCFNICNSGRRGEAKEFSLSYESMFSALKDIKNNIEKFSTVYDETTWRTAASIFSDNTIKSFCGVQTKPFFETINKLLSWANNLHNTDGQMELSIETISNLLDKLETIDYFDDKLLDSEKNNSDSYTSNFSQIIYYGVPGSGKSNEINNNLKKEIPNDKDREFQVCRVVFHPEYTNADFVGQVLPRIKGGDVKYEYKPGPFAKILYRALHNPGKKFFLVIEEINRGNAAAIFGDIFQLLDRVESDKDKETIGNNTFGIGWSKYFIENDYINNYIRSKVEYSDSKYTEEHNIEVVTLGDGIIFSANTSLRLPPNLSLYATMNTSDQNVFTLDNAFQRRWDMKLIENKFEGDDAESQRNAKIGNTNVTWEQFQTHINKKIGEMSSSMGMSSMEDKRLGCWFVKAEYNKISKDKFAEKVLKYLWDDAFKFSREEIFDIKDKTASLESIVSSFKNGDETKPCNWNVFKDTSFVLQQDNTQSESDAGATE